MSKISLEKNKNKNIHLFFEFRTQSELLLRKNVTRFIVDVKRNCASCQLHKNDFVFIFYDVWINFKGHATLLRIIVLDKVEIWILVFCNMKSLPKWSNAEKMRKF